MRDSAAAEHSQHMLYALQGQRAVYPEATHMTCFSLIEEIACYVNEIAHEIAISN